MHTRAAVAVFDAEASNKIVTGKVTSNRSMSRPFPTVVRGVLCRQCRIDRVKPPPRRGRQRDGPRGKTHS
jgi:hypothetical protein